MGCLRERVLLETIIERYEIDDPDHSVLDKAGDILKSGGLVAFPTETVYGLGGDALNPDASKKIYAAKGRPSDNPLIVHIADMDAFRRISENVPDKAVKLAERFWPGPLTMVVEKSDIVPYETTGGLDTVAVRMPSHPVAYELIRRSGVLIAAPSANTSGRPSPTRAAHVIDDLSGKIDMIIDGGPADIGLESSIIDVTGDIPTILRPGYITKEMFEEVLGRVEIDKAILSDKEDPGLRPKAPGMKYRHYAPKGELTIVEGDRMKVAQAVAGLVRDNRAQGLKSAVIICDEDTCLYDLPEDTDVVNIGSIYHEEQIASNLYAVLRHMDDESIDRIYSESFAGSGLGMAVMNRLLKAAGHKIIRV